MNPSSKTGRKNFNTAEWAFSASSRRTTPILFHPHTKESLEHILNLSLNEVIQRYKSAPCHLDVTIDESAKAYLRQFGFIPKLGARPLKALIEKKITGTLANALFLGTIQPDSSVRVVYSDGQWGVL